jgi:hypothetical protein
MTRLVPVLALCCVLVPTNGHALQLRWSSGATNLSFTEATRCTLVVQADSAETVLPAEARLLWVADSSSIQFVALDSLAACQTDTAQVLRIDGPETPADSSANLITAQFCSIGENGPPAADYVVDLLGGAHGKLKVVALDPTDSTQVIESNETTLNGGVEGDYPPVILRATSQHESAILTVTAIGSGLARVGSAALSPPDTAWSLPLSIASQNASSVTATAYLAAPLPACNLRASTGGSTVSFASLPAELPLEPLGKIGSSAKFQPDSGVIQPADFVLYFQSQLQIFHIFYTNANFALLHNLQQAGCPTARDSTTRNLGHAWSKDLEHWVVVDSILSVSPATWDNVHVWAPSIVYNQNDLKFHMFYVGVSWDSTLTDSGWVRFQIQRIGHATASATTPGDSMKTWTRDSWPIFSCRSAEWMSKDTVGVDHDGNQCRDPFVMQDPDTAGHWLMYYVGKNKDTGAYAVGLAKAAGDLTQWRDYGHFYGTDESYTQSTNGFVESPYLIQHYDVSHGTLSRWLFWTQNTNYDTQLIHFQRTVHSASDTLRQTGARRRSYSGTWMAIRR